MKANRNVLEEIRKRKASKKEDGYGYIRLPEQQIEELGILKLAYEIMWSKRGNPSELSIEELEDWELEHVTMEEFIIRLYDGALRIDPKVKDYLAIATEAYRVRERFSGTAREATKKAVRSLALTAKMNGTSIKEEAAKAKEEAARNLHADIPGELDGSLSPEDLEYISQVETPFDSDLQTADPNVDAVHEEVPAKEEKKRFELQYFYVKGSEKIPARFSKGTGSFAADFEGRAKGYDFFSKNGWHLEDEFGRIIDENTALEIKHEHEEQEKRADETYGVIFSADDLEIDPIAPASPDHTYKFVGPEGEFEAFDGYWGAACIIDEENNEECLAHEMFEKGYKLVRDDGKVFTSRTIKMRIMPDKDPIEVKASRLVDFDAAE